MFGHQPAVILVKLMFCRGALQHFLLRRTLYPVFHSQWSCVSFPHCNALWAQSCDPVLRMSEPEQMENETLNVSKNRQMYLAVSGYDDGFSLICLKLISLTASSRNSTIYNW